MRQGCLRRARFARNFFEKSFNSYLELEPPQHSVTRRRDFLAGSARGEARRVARWVLLGVSSRALRAQDRARFARERVLKKIKTLFKDFLF